ncbi:MAG: hypothetical protein COC01_10490 [Bacteroidetes bacterium]|nr:MAG: hypothetical protein COC01_10490 [Bacteroidota bacterium]
MVLKNTILLLFYKNNTKKLHTKLLIKVFILLFLLITPPCVPSILGGIVSDITKGIDSASLWALSDVDSSVIFTDSLTPDTSKIDSNQLVQITPETQISSSAIESKVEYSSDDSIRLDVSEQKVYLFGNANINYEEINLKASYIEFDLKNNIVFAKGTIDSAGKEIGKPVFEDNEQSFSAKTITYNFETTKGLITQVITQEGEGYIHSDTVKKHANDVYFIKNGAYTTCDLEHPHFAIKSPRIKVIPDDKIITGPAYLSIADIPTPLAVPFGIFPNKKGQASGILIPTYGESVNAGFFLQGGGYYFGISDNLDLAIRGDTYTKGSWALRAASSYKKRYKYSGKLSTGYSVFKFGEKELPTFSKTNDFFINWKHDQDPKARPNSRFSANVNARSSTYNKFNSNNSSDYLSNTFKSNISYSKSWAGKPYNLSVNFTHSQNVLNKTVDLNIPEVVFSISRFYPLKRKTSVGKPKFYEKISMGYTTNLRNTISYDSLFTPSNTSEFITRSIPRFRNGMKHDIPISTSFKILKHLNFTPSFNYTERWYLQSIEKRWDNPNNILVTDTIRDFKTARNYSTSAAFTTKLYGMYQFKSKRIKAIRHVLTPSIGFSFRPDFGEEKRGYYKIVQIDTLGNEQTYSIFENSIYGSPLKGKSGLANFRLHNNLEMKVRSLKDTITHTKKIVLIENLTLSTSYNLAADSLKWSKIIISGFTTLFKRLYIKYDARFDPYIIDTLGRNINKFEWKENKRIARFENSDWNFSLNWNIGPEVFKKKKSAKATEEELEMINKHPDAYVDFNIPWSLNLSYSLRHSSNYHFSGKLKPDSITKNIVQTLSFSGDINLTPKWKIGYRSGYDFVNKEISYTTIDIYRDLHCWEMTFNWIPFGFRQSYNLGIKVKASVLEDLKLNRKREWYDY